MASPPDAVRVLTAPKARPLVGVIHLPPLLGPDALSSPALFDRVESDARAYKAAGFDAVIVENYGDAPFSKSASPPHVAAVMTMCVERAVRATGIPVGVNVLRNDGLAALGVSHAAGGSFIRVNVHMHATVTDSGLIEGIAHDVVAYRRQLGRERGPDKILILADVDVKHGTALAKRPLEEIAEETVHRGKADVLLVTGSGTGKPIDTADLERCLRGAPGAPVWAASGVSEHNVEELMHVAGGAIVGTAAKEGGSVKAPVDLERARRIVRAAGKGVERPEPISGMLRR